MGFDCVVRSEKLESFLKFKLENFLLLIVVICYFKSKLFKFLIVFILKDFFFLNEKGYYFFVICIGNKGEKNNFFLFREL